MMAKLEELITLHWRVLFQVVTVVILGHSPIMPANIFLKMKAPMQIHKMM